MFFEVELNLNSNKRYVDERSNTVISQCMINFQIQEEIYNISYISISTLRSADEIMPSHLFRRYDPPTA